MKKKLSLLALDKLMVKKFFTAKISSKSTESGIFYVDMTHQEQRRNNASLLKRRPKKGNMHGEVK